MNWGIPKRIKKSRKKIRKKNKKLHCGIIPSRTGLGKIEKEKKKIAPVSFPAELGRSIPKRNFKKL